jgi:hypothetical protein
MGRAEDGCDFFNYRVLHQVVCFLFSVKKAGAGASLAQQNMVAQASSLCRLGCAPQKILCTENMVIDALWAPRRLISVPKPIRAVGRESEAPQTFRLVAHPYAVRHY